MMFFQDSGVKADSSSGYDPEQFDAVKKLGEFWEKPTNILNNLVSEIASVPQKIGRAILDLDAKSAQLIQVLGVGSKRGQELTSTIADTIPRYLELGLKASDVTDDYKDLVNAFNVNLSLTDDQLVELAATAKITGQEGKVMAKSFQDVGVPISQIGERMVDVAKIANQAGVTVGSVSAGVVKNLDKMNLFNFEGGVKGLAKMAAQASRLGIDMGKIFEITEKVFDPEGAIDFAASLQRLGVQTSELLDPLRLMDLAQNDPTELQNQIVDMTKQFTRFNEQTKQFEILPGAKRQMNEIAKSIGMTGGELQKMALNAANFDMKLKQIKFSPDIKEEDRELIASMAQIDEGGKAQIQVREVDEKTGEWTGEYITKEVGQLTANEIKSLKDEQLLQGETAEGIARNQLSQLVQLNTSIDRLVTSITYGVAKSVPAQKGYKEATDTIISTVEKGKFVTPELVSKDFDNVMKKLMETLDTAVMGIDTSGFQNIINGIGDKIKGVTNYLPDMSNILGTTTATPATTNTITSPATNISSTNTTINTATETAQNIQLTHVFDFSKVPPNLTSAEVTKIMTEWASNPINADAIVKTAKNINTGLIA